MNKMSIKRVLPFAVLATQKRHMIKGFEFL